MTGPQKWEWTTYVTLQYFIHINIYRMILWLKASQTNKDTKSKKIISQFQVSYFWPTSLKCNKHFREQVNNMKICFSNNQQWISSISFITPAMMVLSQIWWSMNMISSLAIKILGHLFIAFMIANFILNVCGFIKTKFLRNMLPS